MGNHKDIENLTLVPRDGNQESVLSSGIADPLEPREGKDLVWRNVNMTLTGKKKGQNKKILENVFGEVPRGHVTAVMGPSGGVNSGKYLSNVAMMHSSSYLLILLRRFR